MSLVSSTKSVCVLVLVPFLLLLSEVTASAAVANGELSTQHRPCKEEGFVVKICRNELAVRREGLLTPVPGGVDDDERSRFAGIGGIDELRKVCDQLADSYAECTNKGLLKIARAETEVQFGAHVNRFNHSSESDGYSNLSQPDKSDLALVLVAVFLVQLGWIATVMRWKQGLLWRKNIETESAAPETGAAVGNNDKHSFATTELS